MHLSLQLFNSTHRNGKLTAISFSPKLKESTCQCHVSIVVLYINDIQIAVSQNFKMLNLQIVEVK